MKKIVTGILTASIGLVLVISDFPCVCAQESDIDEFTLEEITVTAQKREENQQKVPIAMEVISGEDIKEIGRNDIDEILSNISSVLAQTNTDGLRVSVRGVSNDNSPFQNIQASTPTVAVNTDGVYTNRNAGNQNMFDIERVEVLFGPQSTMYASSSPGGIVNVITANPKTDRYEASGTLEYGNYNLLHTEGALNAPLSDTMALRAAFTTSVRDGYLTNSSMDEDIKAARLKALFQPIDKFSVILTGELTKSGGQGNAAVAAFVNQDDVDNPWTSRSDTAGLGRDNEQKKISGRMDWGVGDTGTLSIIPSYLKTTSYASGTAAGMAPPGQAASTYQTTRTGSGNEKGIEARMTSSEDFPFKWIVGGNIYKSLDTQTSSSVNVDLATDTRFVHTTNTIDTTAIYGNITYPFTDRFSATAGARKSWDENTTVNIERPGKGGVAETVEGSKMEYDSPNFKVGFEYYLADDSMLYGDWSSSYRMNGSGITPGGRQMPPEELISYSMGAKNRFFGNKLQINVSAYYYDYTNYFANMTPMRMPVDDDGDGVWEPWDGENSTEEAVNIRTGDAEVYGFDIQTSAIITTKDRLDFSVSYIKKRFTNLFFDLPYMVNYFGIEDVDYSGKDMPQAPNWNVAADYSHNFILENGGTLKFSIDGRYASRTCLNWIAKSLSLSLVQDPPRSGNYTGEYTATVVDTSDTRWQEAYYLANISLVYADPSGKWTISGYVNNLKNYAVKRFLDGMGNLMLGNPRTYGMVLSVRY